MDKALSFYILLNFKKGRTMHHFKKKLLGMVSENGYNGGGLSQYSINK